MGEKLFYSMGEVAEMFDVNQSLIRHWEKQFDVLRPKRNKKGNRLFSPQDVEYLKLIYHLVKERGMTLEGARKALHRHRTDSAVPRDAELMERLQRIRSLLVEVREQLKESPSDEVYSDSEVEKESAVGLAPVEEPVVESIVVAGAVAAEEEDMIAEEPAVWTAPTEEPVVEPAAVAESIAVAGTAERVAAAESDADDAGDSTAELANAPAEPEKPARAGNGGETGAGTGTGTGTGIGKRPRRKKDDDNHELFAYYEQSLF